MSKNSSYFFEGSSFSSCTSARLSHRQLEIISGIANHLWFLGYIILTYEATEEEAHKIRKQRTVAIRIFSNWSLSESCEDQIIKAGCK